VTGVKRAGAGLDDGGARKEPRGADSDAGAAAAAGAAPRANAGAAKQEAFNEMALRFYYKYLFPYNQMFRWLSYGNGALGGGTGPAGRQLGGGESCVAARRQASAATCCPRMSCLAYRHHALRALHHPPARPPARSPPADPDSANPKVKRDYFMKREFTFTMADDVYIRYLSFRDEAELHKAVNARQPEKIDIGPVYNVSVSSGGAVVAACIAASHCGGERQAFVAHSASCLPPPRLPTPLHAPDPCYLWRVCSPTST
jgi:hypothetical protein